MRKVGEAQLRSGAIAMLVLVAAPPGWGQTPLGTAFTYQGRLTSGGAPQDGTCDFEFRLFDAPAADRSARRRSRTRSP